MLFIDEAPVREKIQGTSGFADKFAAAGPRDSLGRRCGTSIRNTA
jgi:hypothetical protein